MEEGGIYTEEGEVEGVHKREREKGRIKSRGLEERKRRKLPGMWKEGKGKLAEESKARWLRKNKKGDSGGLRNCIKGQEMKSNVNR